MNERVETSDWLEPIGEVFYGSCWCEVSNMLTYAEVPGLYVQPDAAFLCAIDHIDAEVAEDSPGQLVVKVTSPTKFKAVVKVLSENSTQMSQVLGQNALWGCRRVVLEPESSQSVVLRKSPSGNPLIEGVPTMVGGAVLPWLSCIWCSCRFLPHIAPRSSEDAMCQVGRQGLMFQGFLENSL